MKPSAPIRQTAWLSGASLALVGGIVLLTFLSFFASAFLPANDGRVDEIRRLAVIAIFTGSYVALAIGRVPGLGIDRAGIALAGAVLMVTSGALPIDDAYAAIDLDTIVLLLGMMIIVACLRLSGFFALASVWVARRARGPLPLLFALTAISGIFSAFLVNDAICLVLTPLVLELTVAMGRRPLPYLLAVAMASNVGSTATITGNPQNIMIGAFSQIPYAEFAFSLGPVAAMGLLVTVALIAVFHRREFFTPDVLEAPELTFSMDRALMVRALMATIIIIVLFFAGMGPAQAAILVGAILLLTGRVESHRIFNEVDWSLLLMFAGLFIIVAGAGRTLLTPDIIASVGALHLDRVPVLAGITAVLSNLVSNVPAVLMMKPFVTSLADQHGAWLVIAMASTLAGNFTVLGSIANLIVVHKAASFGIRISFWDYFKVGAPLTLITLGIGTWWLGGGF